MTLRLVIMGVAGCGKSTVGTALGQRLGIRYQDADALHPATNIEKMRSSIPLTDDDRWPWLDRVAEILATTAPVIVGCSALRRSYRDRIRTSAGGPVAFVHLTGDKATLAARMAARRGHYMPVSLLDSQLAALEPPSADEALTLNSDQPLPTVVEAIVSWLNNRPAG